MAVRKVDYLNTFKSQDLLLPSVQRHVMKKAQTEVDDERARGYMHPSEVSKLSWCRRLEYAKLTSATAPEEGPTTWRRESIFDYGHSVHRKWQKWFWEMGMLWGLWECLCGDRWLGTAPTTCNRGHTAEHIRYREVPVRDEDAMVIGHADGGISMADGLHRLIEVKTVGINTVRFESPQLWDAYTREQLTPDELWFRIKRPFASHMRQGQLYMHFAKFSPNISFDEMVFIYEWKANQDAKEFVVKYNPELISGLLSSMDLVRQAVKAKQPPDKPDWARRDHPTCKACPLKEVCYGTTVKRQARPTTPVIKASSVARRRALGK